MYARGMVLLVVVAVLPLGDVVAQTDAGQTAYQAAAEHYHRQRWRQAAEEFARFLEEHGEHRLARSAEFFAGEASLQSGRLGVALKHYQRYLQLGGSQYESVARFRAGETAYLLKDFDSAVEHLERFVDQNPTDPMCGYANTYLGNISLDANQPAAAVTHFSSALRRFKDESFADESRYGLAQAYQAMGKVDDARRFFNYLASSPKFKEPALLQLAVMALESDHEAGRKQLRELSRTADDDEIATQASYWLGMLAAKQGEWQECADLLTALELEDASLGASAAFTSADAWRKLNDSEAQQAELKKILTKWPQSDWADDAYLALARLAADEGRLAVLDGYAAEFLDKHSASELAPAMARIHGRALLTDRQFSAAARVFELTPPRLRTGSDWYHLALARLAQHQEEEALLALDRVRAVKGTPLYSATLLATATALVRKTRYDQATPIMRQYLELEPEGEESERCRAQLTIALASMGQWDAARESYEQMAEISTPEFWSTTRYMAEGAAARGKREWARKLYLRMAASEFDEGTKATGLAGVAWIDADPATERVDADQQRAAVERLLREFPDHPLTSKVVLRQAQALRSQESREEAIAAYEAFLTRFQDADNVLAARLELAELLDQAGRDEDARAQLELILKTPDPPEVESVRYLLGWVYHDLGKAAASLQQFQWIVENSPRSRLWADAAYRLAEDAAKRKDHDLAESLAKQITDRKEDNSATAHAWYLRGQLAAKQKRWPVVQTYMESVLASDTAKSLYVPARYWLAESQYRRRNYEEAKSAFAALRRLTNGRDDKWLGMLSLRQAQILAHQKQWREAFDLAQQIREDFPEFAQMHEVDYLTGRCQGSWADFAAARDSYQRVVESKTGARTETAAMAQWMIGETYLLQRNYKEAIRAYHRVLAAPRWQAASLLQAAKCHTALGEPDSAAKLLEQLLAEHPNSEYASDAQRRLDDLRQKRTDSTNR